VKPTNQPNKQTNKQGPSRSDKQTVGVQPPMMVYSYTGTRKIHWHAGLNPLQIFPIPQTSSAAYLLQSTYNPPLNPKIKPISLNFVTLNPNEKKQPIKKIEKKKVVYGMYVKSSYVKVQLCMQKDIWDFSVEYIHVHGLHV
jgi:hypothetical protein